MSSPPPGSARPDDLYRDVQAVRVGREEIRRRVEQLGCELGELYRGRSLTIVPVLTGAMFFVADLVRCIPLPLRIRLVSVSSYPGRATRSQGASMRSEMPGDLEGEHVLLVDDILDSGDTMRRLLDAAGQSRPASLRTCVLLRKDRPDLPDRLDADFAGFDVPDEFLVGYGLDYDNLYRNLPEICVLAEHARPQIEPGRDREETP